MHPCNSSSFFVSHATQECIQLNNELFQGRQALSLVSSGIQINIDNLNNYTMPTVAEAMYVPAGPRIMSVTIPPNAVAGSTLTVLAPDNVTRVTVSTTLLI